MLPKDSIANTFLVSILLCVVCSLVVSAAAVNLRPRQRANKELDIMKNVLEVSGLLDGSTASRMSGAELTELFDSRVEKRLVDLASGQYVPDPDPTFDPSKAAKDRDLQQPVKGPFQIGAANREPKTWVYLIKDGEGEIERVVLPIYGMGLWSTLYGFVSLNNDLRTVAGLTFYQHAETPGLGGEVDNPGWKAKWPGKRVWSTGSEPANENLRIGVAKGSPTDDNAPYQVDGLSGATITSRGVDSMLKYWFSQEGFGPFLTTTLASEVGESNG
jgi:Na+-transporting NADH:ubiquinone oxidoreductase subunit C